MTLEAMLGDVVEAAIAALGQGGDVVEARARARAPVRHIFANTGYHIRYKTAAEIESNRAIRANLGLSVEGSENNPHPRIATSARPPVRFRQRRLGAAQALLGQYETEMSRRARGRVPRRTILDRRGAYEVRSKRAVAASFQHRHVGGRLRSSIESQGVTRQGDHAEVWVIAAAPYAKYQEFGTRHNAAHPFLRPAAEESHTEVASLVREAVRGAGNGGSLGVIEVVVRI